MKTKYSKGEHCWFKISHPFKFTFSQFHVSLNLKLKVKLEVKINISEIFAVFVLRLKKYLKGKYHRPKYIILESHVSSLILTTSGRVFYYLTTEPAKSTELRDFERNKRWGLLSFWSFVTCRHEGMMATGKGFCHTSVLWNETWHNKHAAQFTFSNAGHLF